MATLTLVLWLFLAVLVSAVIDQLIPRVSLPLVQVCMGVVVAFISGNNVNIDLDPELFLVLFIAPLLYLEAKDADKGLLWRNKKPILSLAIGLVIVSTLIIGFAVHAMIPAIGLAAAFALGAALGPTDAVAVTSISKQIALPERLWGILKGELLLNDASGIVSFQFALAAAATGAFSLLRASETFLLEFVGGLLFGLAIGYLANFILRKFRDLGIESITFHVLYEICIPFIVYLAATAIHVSGIIAVVVAGLINVIAPRTISPSIAHMNIVSSNVWQVVAFTLNGIVFVLLGTQLPTSMYYTWHNDDISNFMLIVYILVITLVLMAVRFGYCLAMEAVHVIKGEKRKFAARDARNALILTCCGSKGTITLSILFTIPFFMSTGTVFPNRSLIIFLGCGVILCTLLIANFIVPLISPKKVRKKSDVEARINYYETLSDILRNVIEELTAQQGKYNRRAINSVISAYQDRLENTKNHIDVNDGPDLELRMRAMKWEQDRTMVMIDEKLVSADVGYDYLDRLDRMIKLYSHRDNRKLHLRIWATVRIVWIRFKSFIKRRLGAANLTTSRQEEMRSLQLDTASFVINILKGLVPDDDVSTEEASKLLMFYEQRASLLRGSTRSLTKSFIIADESVDYMRLAYQIELEQIQKMYEQDRISRQEANRMRDNVQVMQMDLEDKLN